MTELPPETPPPPPGGYPAPPPSDSGGLPPPAADVYGAGNPYGVGIKYSIGDAFSWAWNKFMHNASALIVATLVLALAVSVVQTITGFLASALDPSFGIVYYGYGLFGFSSGVVGAIVSGIGTLVSLVVGAAIQSAYIGGVLDIADGRAVTIGSFFKPRNVVGVVIASVIVGFVTSIGFFLCFIPGVIAAVLFMFTSVALVERNLSAIDGIKASYELSKARFGDAFQALVVLVAITIVGRVGVRGRPPRRHSGGGVDPGVHVSALLWRRGRAGDYLKADTPVSASPMTSWCTSEVPS